MDSKFSRFEGLPFNLIDFIKTGTESIITLNGNSHNVLKINKDLHAHKHGIHVKIRLEQASQVSNI